MPNVVGSNPISRSMKNLAGDKDCDEFIEVELYKAGLPILNSPPHRSEVPYTKYSEFGPWVFKRAWYYWVARAPEGTGLAIKKALELNSIIGKEVRATGFGGGLTNDELQKQPWPSKYDTIDLYHIDTQDGLIEFVNTLKGNR